MLKIGKIIVQLMLIVFISLLLLSSTSEYNTNFLINDFAYSVFPLGFGGTSFVYNNGSVLINPALGAPLYRTQINGYIGGFDNIMYISSLLILPTNIGTISLYGNFITSINTLVTDYDSYGYFKAAFSKLINEEFYAGFAVDIITAEFQAIGVSLDFGVAFIQKKPIPVGFSLTNISWSLMLKNLGVPVTLPNSTSSPPIGLGAGLSADFLNISDVIFMKLFSDFNLYIYPFGIDFKTGLVLSITDIVNLSGGFTVGSPQTSAYDANYLFFGVQTRIPIGDNSLEITYGYSPSTINPTHSIAVGYAFGAVDKTNPTAALSFVNKSEYFSPNYDGKQDECTLKPDFSDNDIVAGWKVIITDKNGKEVKTFAGEDVRKISYITFEKIITRLFGQKKAVEIPDYIVWDGTDSDGQIVGDGIYQLKAYVWDERYNQAESQAYYATVDTKLGDVSIDAKNKIFSPNNDNNLDTYEIYLKFSSFAGNDTVSVVIKDKQKNVVNIYSYNDASIKSNALNVAWNGNDKNNQRLPEDMYDIEIIYSDKAGNTNISEISNIRLVYRYETVKLALVPNTSPYFSYKSDDQKTVSFTTEVSSTDMLNSWFFTVRNDSGDMIYQKSEKTNVPPQLSWDGMTSKGLYAPDGNYSAELSAQYDSGNNPKSDKIFVALDTTPPVVKKTIDITAFSPNNDGIQDTISFKLNTEKNTSALSATVISENGKEITDIRIQKNNDEYIVIWDGNSQSGAESQGVYGFVVVIKDEAGNKNSIVSEKFRLVREAEKVFVDSDNAFISPNKDNIQDTATLRVTIKDKTNITKTIFSITDANGRIVLEKEYKGFTDSFVFNGETDNKKLSDGIYYYYVKTMDNSGITSESLRKTLTIDTKNPELVVKADNSYFSPDKNGINDSIIINYSANENLDKAVITVFSNDNRKIQEFIVNEKEGSFIWNGLQSNGQKAKDGDYRFNLVAIDKAGNKTIQDIPVFMNTETPDLLIQQNRTVIAPNLQVNNILTLTLQINDKALGNKDVFKSIEVIVKDQKGNQITRREYKEKTNLITIDGKDSSGNNLNDGAYECTVNVMYASGISNTKTAAFFIDTKAPDINVVAKPDLFSPDNDGDKDQLYFTYLAKDATGLLSADIKVYRIMEGNKRSVKPFKTFSINLNSAKESSDQIMWDGKGDMPNTLVDSAVDYVAVFSVTDSLGNATVKEAMFTVDILVIKTDIGYKIIVNAIEFDFNSAVLKPSAYKILNLLIAKLNKFPDYKIMIVGFTDNIGEDEYNRKLSERRAKAVLDYFIMKDISSDRLQFKGMGEQNPIDENNTDEGRMRNRRVEFYLVKNTTN